MDTRTLALIQYDILRQIVLEIALPNRTSSDAESPGSG
jgi:hypothetical protein